MRVYPAGGVPGHLGPLTGPRSEPGMSTGLWIEAQSVQHVLDEAKQAQDYVLVKNPLKDSVAARGIVMPVTVVYFELRHRDGQPAMPLLGTADGSSRITGAHAVLNLVDPRTTHYDLPANRDSYRRFVDEVASSHRAVARCRVPAASNRRRLVVVSAASYHSSTGRAGIREKPTGATRTSPRSG
jgi:hypothetical protein